MPAELRTDNLSAGYGAVPVISNLSISFPAGRLSAILGPNGAGKTTLLRVLGGNLTPKAGRVLLNGTELSAISVAERSRLVALVPQLALDDVPLSVHEMVSIARYPRLPGRFPRVNGDPAVEQALRELDLLELADKPLTQLSGGELRRVLIAQGLAQQTPVLLADEPTAFLDPPARVGLLKRLSQLAHERELCIVAVLHDAELVRRFADHAVLLSKGQAIACGEPGETLNTENLLHLYGTSVPWWETKEERCVT